MKKTAAILAAILSLFISGCSGTDRIEASGTIQGKEVLVTSQVSGRILELSAEEGDMITAEDVLLKVDDTEYQLNYDKAEAAFKIASAQLQEALNGSRYEEHKKAAAAIAQAEANTEALKIRAELLRNDLEKYQQLYAAGGISQKELDTLTSEADIIEEQVIAAGKQEEAAYWQLKMIENGQRNEVIERLQAQVQAAKADLLLAEKKLGDTVISSPVSGRVNGIFFDQGENVFAGKPVASVIDPEDLWIKVFIPEPEIGKIFVGQKAEITVDSFPDRTFEGKITVIADKAQFTPRNVQTKDQRTSTVFPVIVEVAEGYDVLKIGITAEMIFLEAEEGEQ